MIKKKREPETNQHVSEFYVEKCRFCGANLKIESMNTQEVRYCSTCSKSFFVTPSADSDKNYHGSVELINENVNDMQPVSPDLYCKSDTIKQEMDPLSDEIVNQPLDSCIPIYKTEPDKDQGCSYSYLNSSSYEDNDMFEATDTKFSISDYDTDQICWNIDKSQHNKYYDQSSTDFDEKPIVKWKLFENKSDKEKNWNLKTGSPNDSSPTKIQIQPQVSNKHDTLLQNNSKSIDSNKISAESNKFCDCSSQKDNLLESHVKSLRRITRKLKFYCDLCSAGFSYKSTLITHLKKLHFDQAKQCFSCDLCRKKYKKKGHIVRHMLTAHIKSMHDCLACGEKFKEKRGLTIHIERFHSGNLYKYKCELCKQNFKSISNYKDHKLNVHSSVSDICTCDICGNQYKNKIRLRVHKNRVHCEYRHQCRKCGKVFKRSCHLKVHTNYHCN